jgi:arylsulfatase A-like enzyme
MRMLLALFVLSASLHAADRPPNIVFMLIDDMGWTDLGCYGSKFYQTPNIDKLARDGMRFTQAYAACTVCSPTRAAIMTGKYPARLHITDWIAGHARPFAKLTIPDWQMHLPLEEETIAERLKTKGYATASIGKWHLGGEGFLPTNQGFDVNVAGLDIGSPPSYFSPYKIKTLPDGPPGEFLTDRLTQEAIKFIDANKDKPFYIYLPHYAVHTPIQAKKEVIEKYRQIPVTPQHSNPVYAGLIESVDDSVGALRARLGELGLADNTLFVFTSDNGGLSHVVGPQGWKRQSTDNSPSRLGKGSSFDGGVHIPLIVAWPGKVKPGTVCDVPVISVDHYPTLLEITGIPAKEGHQPDGESIVPLLTQSGSLKRDAIYWHYPHYHPGSATPYSAVREGDWKLIEFLEDNHVELYNMKRDLGESDNVAAENTEKVSALKSKLETWRKEVGAQMPVRNPAYDPDRAWEGPGEAKGKGKGKGKKGA